LEKPEGSHLVDIKVDGRILKYVLREQKGDWIRLTLDRGCCQYGNRNSDTLKGLLLGSENGGNKLFIVVIIYQ
jgi:hypothetical protein